MFLVFVTCVAATALSDAAPNIDLGPMERGQSDSEIIVKDYSAENRQKRWVPVLLSKGLGAVKKLFAGSEQFRSYEKNTENFVKYGDYNKAYKDFLSVRPTAIRQRTTPAGIKIVQGHKDGFKLKLRSPGYKARADVIIDVIDYGHKTNKETQKYSIMYYKNKPKS